MCQYIQLIQTAQRKTAQLFLSSSRIESYNYRFRCNSGTSNYQTEILPLVVSRNPKTNKNNEEFNERKELTSFLLLNFLYFYEINEDRCVIFFIFINLHVFWMKKLSQEKLRRIVNANIRIVDIIDVDIGAKLFRWCFDLS